MLAMVVNDNVGCLMPNGVRYSIASMLAPTGDRGSAQPSAFSIAWMTAGSSGAVRGEKRARTRPSLPSRNFSKFQVMSPGNSAPSPASRRYNW